MLKCRIRDATFSHDRSATAWKIPKHMEWVRDESLTLVSKFGPTNGPNFYVDGHIQDSSLCYSNEINFGWLHEPPELHPLVYERAPAYVGAFKTILTYHPDLLALPGYTFMPYGGVWIEEKDWGLKSKTGLCSMLIGSKLATSGHRIRHAIADLLPDSVSLFGSRGTPTDYSIKTKLTVLAPFAFTIVTEAQRLDNLFTEILLDCFAVGTVPIFWGCPNAAQFFNAAGILSFETPEQCAAIVAGLSWELYESMLPAVADNLVRVGQYAVCEDFLYENILKEYDHA